eukprot:877684-Prymnesium_polylepis.1
MRKRRSSFQDPLPMRIDILKPNPGRAVNKITTAQYTPFTFLPAVLYFQFHPLKCFSNFYFACIGAMQMVQIISITRGVPN